MARGSGEPIGQRRRWAASREFPRKQVLSALVVRLRRDEVGALDTIALPPEARALAPKPDTGAHSDKDGKNEWETTGNSAPAGL